MWEYVKCVQFNSKTHTMAESKFLDEDKDEWFYHTMNKYSNLYMFELEFPIDTLEVINEDSLCISGLQTFSKKCELLQLCVPPKLLRSENEEGLCKDRDFKILSGGYSEGKIVQMNAVKNSKNLIATQQEGFNGVVIYEVGDDQRATILEKHRLTTDNIVSGKGKPLCCLTNSLILATDPNTEGNALERNGILLNEWRIDDGLSQASASNPHVLWKNTNDLKCGYVEKIKPWDDDNRTCIFLTSTGTVAIHDLRSGTNIPSIFFHASKSLNNHIAPISTSPMSASSTSTPPLPVVFTFDCLPQNNKIGVLDSCGGYETFDPRFITEGKQSPKSAESSSAATNRCLLPEFTDLAGLYPSWFNIEYEGRREMREKEMSTRFIISGLKRECVPVFQEVDSNSKVNLVTEDSAKKNINVGGSGVEPVFSHDGHSKPVSHSIWHPVAKDLVFSASLDAVLHAWQFIPEK